MRMMLVGAGAVGESILKVMQWRDPKGEWLKYVLVCDYDLKRAEEVVGTAIIDNITASNSLFEAVFLYNRKCNFLLYKKPPAGCALARIRIMSQASPYPLRSLLDERHWRSATRSARECAKAHSLFLKL